MENPRRTKQEAQDVLFEKFGMSKTANFQQALREKRFEDAEAWLNYIIQNKDDFPQYHATWDDWLEDRRQDIAEAKGK